MAIFIPGVIGPKRRELVVGSRNPRSDEKYHHRSFLSGTSTGSKMDGSSFSGLFTFVEIGHIVMGSEGKGTSRSRGSGSAEESHRS